MKKFIVFLIAILVVTGFVSWLGMSSFTLSVCKAAPSQDASSKQKVRAKKIIAKLRSNFEGLDKVFYQVQWDSLNNDNGESSFLTEIRFKRPFHYLEKGIKGRVYTYVSNGKFEKFTYKPKAGDGFVGKSKSPPIEQVNEAGFLERFPLRILQTKNMEFVREDIVVDPSKNKVNCEVIRNDYWQVYVAKDSNLVIQADYYRERGNTQDVITSLCDFKYSKVKVGEKKFIYFPMSFKAVIPSTKYAWKCNILRFQANDQTSFDDSIFKLRK